MTGEVLAVLKAPQHTQLLVKVQAVCPAGSNMLALHDILLIDPHHQLLDVGIGASHDVAHGVEEGHNLVQAVTAPACPGC